MYTNSIYTLEALKKMNSNRLNVMYTQIFGFEAFNPFNRFELILEISGWMAEQVSQFVNALTGAVENVWAELVGYLKGFTNAVAKQMENMKNVEAKRVIADNIVDVVTGLLGQGFTCAAIGAMNMGVSAKQASRIKRGRRYSNVSGIEEVKPVARQYSVELAVFA